MFTIKQDVKVTGLKPEMLLALMVANSVYAKYNADLVLTSGLEGRHKRNSHHYLGYAIDLRIWTIPVIDRLNVVRDIELSLTPDYTVILEKDHIHIHYSPL